MRSTVKYAASDFSVTKEMKSLTHSVRMVKVFFFLAEPLVDLEPRISIDSFGFGFGCRSFNYIMHLEIG